MSLADLLRAFHAGDVSFRETHRVIGVKTFAFMVFGFFVGMLASLLWL